MSQPIKQKQREQQQQQQQQEDKEKASSLALRRYRGSLCVVGNGLNALTDAFVPFVPQQARLQQQLRDNTTSNTNATTSVNDADEDASTFHITVVSAGELRQCNEEELVKLQQEQEHIASTSSSMIVHALGLAHVLRSNQQAWYVAVYSPLLQQFRRSLGLGEKDFHITLGFQNGDPHGSGSETSTLVDLIVRWATLSDLSKISNFICSSHTRSTCCGITYTQELAVIRRVSCQLTDQTSNVTESEMIDQLKLIGQYAIQSKDPSLLSIAEDIGWNLVDRGYLFAIRLLLQIFVSLGNEQTQFEMLLGHFPLAIKPTTLAKLKSNGANKVLPHLEDNIREINRVILENPSLQLTRKNQRNVLHINSSGELKFVLLPRNFSWINLGVEQSCHSKSSNLLAGSAYPSSSDHLSALHGIGIRHILTVHEGAIGSPLVMECARSNIKTYHYDVVDRTPPTFQQLKDMVRLIHNCVKSNEGILVHCQGGVGRTNTVIIAYLMCIRPSCSAAELIAEVTEQRKLILSQSQQECLRSWYRLINEEDILSINNVVEMAESDVSDVLEQQVNLPEKEMNVSSVTPPKTVNSYVKIASALNIPPLIMLCGIPSSGKSTLSKAMVEAYPDFFVRINRDERRGKGECDELLQKGLRPYLRGLTVGKKKMANGHIQQCVILDGCHISKQKRTEWLQAAHNVPAWCIVFERSIEECKNRIQVRTNHPTIPAGTAGLPIIDSMLKQYEAPSVSEGFSRVITVSCDEDMESLLASLKVPFQKPAMDRETSNSEFSSPTFQDKPIKFPRTSHAINLGAATRDDKILPTSDLHKWIDQSSSSSNMKVIIEEKIDGANIGFSIHPGDNRIIAQNRSHFISSQYHAQFSPLDKWISQHGQELWNILEPGKHILYGEWLFATHSVSYNHLPDYFVAYDLLDVTTNSFLSRAELAQLLKSTTIPHVALVYEGVIESVEHLKSFVYGPSVYGDEPREGIVIRMCDNSKVVSRAKLVRPDFIAGNERWNRSAKLQTNKLLY